MVTPKKYFFDRSGKPLAFGKVYTYQAGTNINQETFTSEAGDIANTNPVILNGEGYADIYLNGSYRIVLKDKNDNDIWSADPVSSSGYRLDTYKVLLIANGYSGEYGFFEDGFDYVNEGDVGISVDGKIYVYVGDSKPVKNVPPGTNPDGDADYKQVIFNSTENIKTSSGESLEQVISEIENSYIKYFIRKSDAVNFGYTSEDEGLRLRIQDSEKYTDYEIVTVNSFGDDIDLGSGVYARRIKSYEEKLSEAGSKFTNYLNAQGSGSQGQPLYIIGDSIPEGSNSSNFAEKSYVALLRKTFNKVFSNRNYGFANFNFRVPNAVSDPHIVTRNGFTSSVVDGDSFNPNYFGGIMIESGSAGEWVEFTYTGKDFLIVYGENPGGGTIDVALDGAPFASIDTAVVPAQKYTGSTSNGRFSAPLTPSKWGLHTVRLTTTSAASVRLCGVVYCENFSTKISSPTIFNLGRSSITLSEIPDNLLSAYCNGGTIMLSIGVNDDLLSKPIAVFRAKLELVLNKIKTLNGSAIVTDFIFSKGSTNQYKFALRELASKYGFKLFDFNQLWFSSETENLFSKLLDTDAVHPTDAGHLDIAKNICEYIKLPLHTETKPKKELKSLVAGVSNLSGYEPVSTFIDGDITHISGVAENTSGASISQNTKLVNIGQPTPKDPQIIPILTRSGMAWVEVRSDGWIYTGFGSPIAVGDWFSLNMSFVNTST